MNPLVSIITRCKNRAEHLRLSLRHMLFQTYAPLEVIVVDYGSDDNLYDVIRESYLPAVLSSRLQIIRVDDAPLFHPAHAQNVGIRHTHGDWLLFMDADNLMKPYMVAHLLSRLDGQERIFARPIMDYMHPDQAGQLFARRNDVIAIGGFMESLTLGWGYEDGDIRDRLLLYGNELFKYSSSLTDVIEHAEEKRTGHMTSQDRSKSGGLHQELSRKNKMWNGWLANKGREWGLGGRPVTFKEIADGLDPVASEKRREHEVVVS